MSKKISEFDEATTLSGFTIAGIQGGDNKRAPSTLLQDFIETVTSDILDGFFVNGKGTTFSGDRYDLGGIIEDSSVEIGSIATLGDNAMSYLSFINDGTESTLALGSQADISFIPSIAYLALSPDYGRLIWDLGNGTVEETIEVGVNGIRLNYDNGTVSNSLEVNDLAIEAIFANSSYSFADGIFILTATDGINGTSTIGANATQASMSVQYPDSSNYAIGVTNVGITLQYNPFGSDPSQIIVDADISMEADGDIILPDFVNANLGTDATGRLINLDNLALRKIITGTTYEVEQEDNGYLLICTNATGTLITIPSTLTDNFSFATLRAQGAGVVDHTDDGTSVLLTYNNQYSLEEENTACTWVCTEVEVFYGFGAFGGNAIGIQDVLDYNGEITTSGRIFTQSPTFDGSVILDITGDGLDYKSGLFLDDGLDGNFDMRLLTGDPSYTNPHAMFWVYDGNTAAIDVNDGSGNGTALKMTPTAIQFKGTGTASAGVELDNDGYGAGYTTKSLIHKKYIQLMPIDMAFQTGKGPVIKDSASPAHYWRIVVDAAGNLDTVDLGTTPP